MAKRLCDVFLAVLGLLLSAPLLAVAAIGIRRSSPGPLLYRAPRLGRYGQPFMLYKLRTMHVDGRAAGGSRITGAHDDRVFWFGSFLRKAKLDELPQLLNVVRGEMSLVGPRPEDPTIVRACYTTDQLETLSVRPGLASPGSLFNYTHGDYFLAGPDAESAYITCLLPIKLALDLHYVRRTSLVYDARIVARTVVTITAKLCGKRQFGWPCEFRYLPPPLVAAAQRACSVATCRKAA